MDDSIEAAKRPVLERLKWTVFKFVKDIEDYQDQGQGRENFEQSLDTMAKGLQKQVISQSADFEEVLSQAGAETGPVAPDGSRLPIPGAKDPVFSDAVTNPQAAPDNVPAGVEKTPVVIRPENFKDLTVITKNNNLETVVKGAMEQNLQPGVVPVVLKGMASEASMPDKPVSPSGTQAPAADTLDGRKAIGGMRSGEIDNLIKTAGSIGYKLHLSGIPARVSQALEKIVHFGHGQDMKPRLVLVSDKSAKTGTLPDFPEMSGHGQFYTGEAGPAPDAAWTKSVPGVNREAGMETFPVKAPGKGNGLEGSNPLFGTSGKEPMPQPATGGKVLQGPVAGMPEGGKEASTPTAGNPVVSDAVPVDPIVPQSGKGTEKPKAGNTLTGASAGIGGNPFSTAGKTPVPPQTNLAATGFGQVEGQEGVPAGVETLSPDVKNIIARMTQFVDEINTLITGNADQADPAGEASGAGAALAKTDIIRARVADVTATPITQGLARKIINGFEQFQEVEPIGLTLAKDGLLRLNTSVMATQLSSKKEETIGALKDFGSMLSERINYFVNPYPGIYADDKKILQLKGAQKDEGASLLNKEIETQQGRLEKKLKELQLLIERSSMLKEWFSGSGADFGNDAGNAPPVSGPGAEYE